MGQIGGFDLRAQGKSYGKSHYRMDLWLERTGYEQEVELSDDLTALGLISRLEYMLDRFEADLRSTGAGSQKPSSACRATASEWARRSPSKPRWRQRRPSWRR